MKSSKAKRYTTDKPEGNVDGYRNVAFIKNREVYLRGIDDGNDMSLDAYCKKECKAKCDIDFSDVPVDEFAENMECDCPVSVAYFTALAAAELREKLARYEDTGLEPEEIKQPKRIHIKNQLNDKLTIEFCCGNKEYKLDHDEQQPVDIEDGDCLYLDIVCKPS
jgi:hypothetical protein